MREKIFTVYIQFDLEILYIHTDQTTYDENINFLGEFSWMDQYRTRSDRRSGRLSFIIKFNQFSECYESIFRWNDLKRRIMDSNDHISLFYQRMV